MAFTINRKKPKHCQCCRISHRDSTPYFPSSASSQAYPDWGSAPAKSCSFRPHCSTQFSLKAFGQWIGPMTGLWLCAEHIDTRSMWFLYGLNLSMARKDFRARSPSSMAPLLTRPVMSYVTLGN